MELLCLLGEADRALGKLDMYSEYIPNIDLFISMHVAKEATQSSKIEGTQTNIEETIMDRTSVQEEKRDDWEEVQNYIRALSAAIGNLQQLPFSSRLIRNTHKILLEGVRGMHKLPGEFRSSQNWIGGATLKDATFIPPVHTSIGELMSDLEHFAHDQDHYFPELLKIAIIHYQFETIHPFLDGNGRVGRLMITLYLVERGILSQPILYLSDFFERHRILYYDNLNRVREKNDLLQWCKFFLVGIIETAKDGIHTFDRILHLRSETEEKIQSLGSRAKNGIAVLHHLFQRPLVDAAKASEITGLSLPSSYKLIDDLEKMGILKEITGAKRDRLYVFEEYLDLFR
jgi:Fic family protein